jgi:hypothetical protein
MNHSQVRLDRSLSMTGINAVRHNFLGELSVKEKSFIPTDTPLANVYTKLSYCSSSYFIARLDWVSQTAEKRRANTSENFNLDRLMVN